jgi:hypothetical protein
MNAKFARRLTLLQETLIALSAPTLLRESPLRPPLATAPLAKSLTLRELAMLTRVRNQAVAHA